MNEFLAQLYGTAENIGTDGDDTTKLAQAQVMNEMFEAEGIDVDQLAPDTIVKVAESLFGDDNEITHEDVGAEPQMIDDSEEKLAEADFLGRVMAHSYVDEMTEIEKRAGKGKLKDVAGKVYEWTGAKGAREAHKAMKGAKGEEKAYTRAVKKLEGQGDKGTGSHTFHSGLASRAGEDVKTYKGVRKEYLKQLGKRVGLPAAGVAAAGGGAYGGYKAMKKKESALDVLAEQRALEILAENGIGVSGEEKLASAVEERAYEMLVEAGYIE